MNDNQTSNMYLAAALVSYGAEIESVNRDNPRRLMWVFRTIPKFVYLLSDDEMETRSVESIDEIKALMASNKMLFMPNFVSSINHVKSYLFAE